MDAAAAAADGGGGGGGGGGGNSCLFNLTNQAAAVHASNLLLLGMCDAEAGGVQGSEVGAAVVTGSANVPFVAHATPAKEPDLCSRLKSSAARGYQKLHKAVLGLKSKATSSSDVERDAETRLRDLLLNPAMPLF